MKQLTTSGIEQLLYAITSTFNHNRLQLQNLLEFGILK